MQVYKQTTKYLTCCILVAFLIRLEALSVHVHSMTSAFVSTCFSASAICRRYSFSSSSEIPIPLGSASIRLSMTQIGSQSGHFWSRMSLCSRTVSEGSTWSTSSGSTTHLRVTLRVRGIGNTFCSSDLLYTRTTENLRIRFVVFRRSVQQHSMEYG